MKNIKFFVLCIVVGIAVGIVTTPYRWLLQKAVVVRDILFAHDIPWWQHIVVLAVMWVVAMGIYWLVTKDPLIDGSGIPQAEGAVMQRFHLPHAFRSLISKFVGGVSGIGMGFSLGREGPSVQMGAYVARLIGKWTKTKDSLQKYLVIGGSGAGLSSAFTAPIASACFVIEEMETFVNAKIAIAGLLGCIAAGWIAKIFIPGNPYAVINTDFPDNPDVWWAVCVFAGFALLIALLGWVFNFLTIRLQDLNAKIHLSMYVKLIALIGVTYIIAYYFSDLVAGGESFLGKEASSIHTGLWWLAGIVVLKLVFTPFCYSFGLPGGIFLPLLVTGGLAGKWYALLLASWGVMDPHYFGTFMIIGMSALFAAVVRSPITGLLLILEMTGKFNIFFPMVVVVGLAFFFSHLAGVKPIYDLLYDQLLPKDVAKQLNWIRVPYQVGPGAFFVGKKVSDMRLPYDAEIESIVRDGEMMPLETTPIEPWDELTVNVRSRSLEKLYRAFRDMAAE